MVIPDAQILDCLQLGVGWLPEQTGGLNQYYYDLVHHLPTAGVRCQSLLAGDSQRWPTDAALIPQAYTPLDSPLWKRWWTQRRAVSKFFANRPQ